MNWVALWRKNMMRSITKSFDIHENRLYSVPTSGDTGEVPVEMSALVESVKQEPLQREKKQLLVESPTKKYFSLEKCVSGWEDVNVITLFTFTILAISWGVATMFGAFVAGIVVGHSGNSLQKQKDNIKLISMNLFVPVYFAFVGFKINLKSDFHLLLFVAFLLGSSLIKGLGVFCGTQMVKMPFKESLNFAFALNARGGPGIVLATLAFDAGLISAYFFTTLVITAIVTSLMAGSWLKRKVALEPTLEKI